MSYLPQVIGARYVSDFIVSTRFDDGTEKRIDVSQWSEDFRALKASQRYLKFF